VPIYLYCLLPADAEPLLEGVLGVDDAAVRIASGDAVRAVVSEVSDARVAISAERARAHDRVVRAAMEACTPLPARFGQTFADESAMRVALAPKAAAITDALARVAGCVEMTLRLRSDAWRSAVARVPDERDERAGARYLGALAAQRRVERDMHDAGAVLRDRIRDSVGELVRGERWEAAAGSGSATVSHLVPREGVSSYRDAVRAAAEQLAGVEAMLSGPWAPYAFARLDEEPRDGER
jgi:hypothetical protein